MGKTNLRMRAGALVAGLVCALAGQPVLAQDAPPSDSEMASAAPAKDSKAKGSKDAKDDAAESAAKAKEVEEKHVERVKKINSIFAKLKQQVEVMEQVNAAPPAQMAPDLPPEALITEDDPAPSPGDTSVLDEAPSKPVKGTKIAKKAGKKAAAEEIADEAGGGEREVADSAGGATGTYTVQKGDTLGKIAAKTLGSSKKASAIAKANGMGVTDPLRVGKSLIIPGGGMTADAAVGDVAVASADKASAKKGPKAKKERKPKNPKSEPVLDYSNYDFKMYVVKPGDSISKIAKAFYESGNGAELIRKYNKKSKDEDLKAGEKILIPLPKQKASDDRYEKAKKGLF